VIALPRGDKGTSREDLKSECLRLVKELDNVYYAPEQDVEAICEAEQAISAFRRQHNDVYAEVMENNVVSVDDGSRQVIESRTIQTRGAVRRSLDRFVDTGIDTTCYVGEKTTEFLFKASRALIRGALHGIFHHKRK